MLHRWIRVFMRADAILDKVKGLLTTCALIRENSLCSHEAAVLHLPRTVLRAMMAPD